jgi:hypothetical protein
MPAAIVSSARAIRSTTADGAASASGRFVARVRGLRDTAFDAGREPVLRDFFAIFAFPEPAPLARCSSRRKQPK